MIKWIKEQAGQLLAALSAVTLLLSPVTASAWGGGCCYQDDCCDPCNGWWNNKLAIWGGALLLGAAAGAGAGYAAGNNNGKRGHTGPTGPTGPAGTFPVTTGSGTFALALTPIIGSTAGTVIPFVTAPDGFVYQLPAQPYNVGVANPPINIGPINPLLVGTYTVGLQVVTPGILLAGSSFAFTVTRDDPASSTTVTVPITGTVGPDGQVSGTFTVSGGALP